MAQPPNPDPYPPPNDGGRPKTYPQLVRQLSCVVTGGAQIKPTPPPSATVNIGDVIADHAGKLSAFTSAYAVAAVLMRIISCMIDVLCALTNPFAVVAAMIRLFGICIPEFILVLPQLAIPAKVICLLKIIIAIITYIVDVIIPLIEDIIQNVNDLQAAVQDGNADAQAAVAFKIVSLLKELFSVIGILAALDALIIMIRALLESGFGLPCSGGGGSCGGCGEEQCPEIVRNRTISGIDGRLTVLFGPDGGFSLRFTSESHRSDFAALRDFMPDGVDYGDTDDLDRVAYTLSAGGVTYIVRGIDRSGGLYLVPVQESFLEDGYLSNVRAPVVGGTPTVVDVTGQNVRFGTDTPSFSTSDTGGYLQLFETNSNLDASKNAGTFRIIGIYDGYNTELDGGSANAWDAYGILDPKAHVVWRKLPRSPGNRASLVYEFEINHDELVRRSMIGLGCHPDVKTAIEGTRNRFPVVDEVELPDFPDISGLTEQVTACLEAVAPQNVDTQYVLDNSEAIATSAAGAASCVSGALQDLSEAASGYAGQLYPRLVDVEDSIFSVDRERALVGSNVIVTVVPLDFWDSPLAAGLPPGTVEVDILTTFGNISEVEELVADDGTSSGEFRAVLTSRSAGQSRLTASIAGTFISDFDENLDPPDLAKRVITVEFVDGPAKAADRKPAVSREPLGDVHG